MLTMLVLALCLMVWFGGVAEAVPMGTAFTYEGHLYDASHVANGLYDFQFKLWTDPCRTEPVFKRGDDVNKPDVDVIDGYFTVVLDFNSPWAFDGSARWLEIGVRPGEFEDPNTYSTLSPRQEITPTPYAMYSQIAENAEDAYALDGYDHTEFAWTIHAHSGDDITSGSVGEGYIDSLIARDSEIMSWVLAGDGPGSGLDADLLDGQNSADFSSVSHSHDGSDITSGMVTESYIDGLIARDSEIMSWVLAGDGPGSTLDADYLDGLSSGAFAPFSHSHGGVYALVTHIHDDRYYTESEADTRFVNTTGDSMSGTLTVTSSSLKGVDASTSASNGHGVYGYASNPGAGSNYGGYFVAAGGEGRGVRGVASNSDGGSNVGGLFEAAGSSGWGVYGKASNPNDVITNYGGYFEAAGGFGRGVYGEASSPNVSSNYGGYFVAGGHYGVGVYGEASNPNDPTNYGGHFTAAGKYGVGGLFEASGTDGIGISASGGAFAAHFAGDVLISTGDVLITSGRVTTPVLEITGGADVSEQFEIGTVKADVLPSAGMVVSIDAENPGALVVSDKGYDRRVAGIISGAGGVKPGMLMGQQGTMADGEHPVALTGRVYCRADASGGSIEPGDLLTSSETAGHAMKVTDYARAQGAVLGKAMSSLTEGQGLVLVLVNLQ